MDIIRVLTQTDYQSARKYWKVLKGRLNKEGSELVTKCYQLKMRADDGKERLAHITPGGQMERLARQFSF